MLSVLNYLFHISTMKYVWGRSLSRSPNLAINKSNISVFEFSEWLQHLDQNSAHSLMAQKLRLTFPTLLLFKTFGFVVFLFQHFHLPPHIYLFLFEQWLRFRYLGFYLLSFSFLYPPRFICWCLFLYPTRMKILRYQPDLMARVTLKISNVFYEKLLRVAWKR